MRMVNYMSKMFDRKVIDKATEENIVYTLDDVIDGVEIEIAPMRQLGEGRWDKKLKQQLVDLSEADNYEDAKDEWKATGNCWWGYPDDPRRTPPDWMANQHIGHCLCGHIVYYHFEIENTVNGHKDVVGSDHIHAFMIVRAVSEEFGVDVNAVTERMIQQWLAVRVKGMINDAWWYANGDEFHDIFEEIKELDLRINVTTHPNKKYWDRELRQFRPVTYLRKRGSGKGAMRQLASIVWRWNHPDNSRRQIDTRGWPNAKLWKDMNLFSARLEDHIETDEKLKKAIDDRLEYIDKLDRSSRMRIAESYKRSEEAGKFSEQCVLFDIPEFNHKAKRVDRKDELFLLSLHHKIMTSTPDRIVFTPRDMDKLKEVMERINQPLATQEDLTELRRLKKIFRERNMGSRIRVPRIAYQVTIQQRIENLTRRIERDIEDEENQRGRYHPDNRGRYFANFRNV